MTARAPAAGDLAADFLPHAAPFLLLDRVLAIDEDGGRFSKCVSADDPLVGTSGLLSPVLIVEAMAQGAGLVLMHREPGIRERGSAVLAAIDHCEVTESVRAGDLLVVDIRMTRRYGDMARISGRATADGRACAVATLTLAFAPHARSGGA